MTPQCPWCGLHGCNGHLPGAMPPPAAQGELLPPSHRSRQPQRLRKRKDAVNGERVYAARWHRYVRERLSSSGATKLEAILAPDCVWTKVTRRDAAVAASVIQWLGTPCGLGFIMGCERAIEELHAKDLARACRPSLMAAQDAEQREAARRRAIALGGLLR